MQYLGGMIAGNPAGSFRSAQMDRQKVDTGEAEAAGDAAFGRALQALYNAPFPGATPTTVPPGAPSMAAQPPQSPSPMGGGVPGGPQMPGGAMPPRPPAPIPGAMPQPMGGPPPQPGMPPGGGGPPQSMGGQPPMGGPPGGPPPMGGPQFGGQGGGITWQMAIQAVTQANPGIQSNPRALARAVDHFMPIMNQQSMQQWREVQGQLRAAGLDVREDALRARERIADQAERGRGERFTAGEEGRNYRTGVNADVRREGYTSREGIAERAETGRTERSREAIAQRDRATDVRRELGLRGIESREGIAGRAEEGRNVRSRENIQSREGIAERTEAGRQRRFEVSDATRREISTMSIESREEIARQLEEGRLDRAKLSIETRRELAALSVQARKEIADMNEWGREERSQRTDTRTRDIAERAETGRQDRFESGQQYRTDRQQQADEARDRRQQEGIRSREGIAERAEEGRTGRSQQAETGRQQRFEERERRLTSKADFDREFRTRSIDLAERRFAETKNKQERDSAYREEKTRLDEQYRLLRERIAATNAGDTKVAKALEQSYQAAIKNLESAFMGRSSNRDMKTGPGEVAPKPVPLEFKGDPDGTTYNNGAYIKRGDQMVPNDQRMRYDAEDAPSSGNVGALDPWLRNPAGVVPSRTMARGGNRRSINLSDMDIGAIKEYDIPPGMSPRDFLRLLQQQGR